MFSSDSDFEWVVIGLSPLKVVDDVRITKYRAKVTPIRKVKV